MNLAEQHFFDHLGRGEFKLALKALKPKKVRVVLKAVVTEQQPPRQQVPVASSVAYYASAPRLWSQQQMANMAQQMSAVAALDYVPASIAQMQMQAQLAQAKADLRKQQTLGALQGNHYLQAPKGGWGQDAAINSLLRQQQAGVLYPS